MIKTNFHTHTCYCDGENTPEEMVKAAIEKGFTAIGFSGHSFNVPDADFAMNETRTAEYIKEISKLKLEYKDKIKIFCGIEQDYFSSASTAPFDYIIGSVHYVKINGEYRAVDRSAEITKETVDSFYGGDFDTYAEDYFSLVSDVAEKTKCDIIGHFDLVSKYSEQNGYGQTKRFLTAAEKAVKELVKYDIPFEINTGAMARGSRSIPYPSPEILKIINASGGKIVFSSDCHCKQYLDFAFDTAEKLARDCGFKKQGIITESGIKYLPI